MNTIIVEDNDRLAKALFRALKGFSNDIRICGSVKQALEAMNRTVPQLILLDFQLPDGDGFMVLDYASTLKPAPHVIAMSSKASPEDSFRLAQKGVRGFLPKPIDLTGVQRMLTDIITAPVDVQPHLRNIVGQQSLQEVQEQVRRTMVEEAFEKSGKNVRATARLLKTSRQVIQYLLRLRRARKAQDGG